MKNELEKQLAASGLPAGAQNELRNRFEAASSMAGLGPAIAEAREFWAQVHLRPRSRLTQVLRKRRRSSPLF